MSLETSGVESHGEPAKRRSSHSHLKTPKSTSKIRVSTVKQLPRSKSRSKSITPSKADAKPTKNHKFTPFFKVATYFRDYTLIANHYILTPFFKAVIKVALIAIRYLLNPFFRVAVFFRDYTLFTIVTFSFLFVVAKIPESRCRNENARLRNELRESLELQEQVLNLFSVLSNSVGVATHAVSSGWPETCADTEKGVTRRGGLNSSIWPFGHLV